MYIKFSLSLIFFLACNGAVACPEGQQPAGNPTAGNPSGCVPYSVGSTSRQHAPQGHWETRWGVIAIGATTSGGGVGIAKNMTSKRSAEKAALSQCKATGGGEECKKNILRYFNQCAVIAWGDGSYSAQGAETIQIASDLAMQKCSSKTTNCKIYYADCSLPAWVK